MSGSDEQQVLVIAPTHTIGESIARDFGYVNVRRMVHSQPHTLYGYARCVVLLCNGDYPWKPDKLVGINDALRPGRHTIISVPNYALRKYL